MSTLGFDRYIEPLSLYLQKFREAPKETKNKNDRMNEMQNRLPPARSSRRG